MLRTSALIAVMPAFSMAGIPAKIRVALGALTALFVTGSQPAISLEGWSLVHLVMLMGSELVVGLLLGFVSKMFFYALDIAGSLIAMSLGIMMPTDINPYQTGQASIPTAILYQLAIGSLEWPSKTYLQNHDVQFPQLGSSFQQIGDGLQAKNSP